MPEHLRHDHENVGNVETLGVPDRPAPSTRSRRTTSMVGSSTDRVEQEADDVAAAVVARSDGVGSSRIERAVVTGPARRSTAASPVIRRDDDDSAPVRWHGAPQQPAPERQVMEDRPAEPPPLSDKDTAFARQWANDFVSTMYEGEVQYVFKGLGGGGARWYRSSAVRKFRAAMKQAARLQALADVDRAAASRTDGRAGTATADYQKLVGGNIAYSAVKKTIDEQLDEEAKRIVGTVDFQAFRRRIEQAMLDSFRHYPGDGSMAFQVGHAEWESASAECRAVLTRLKDAVVGKRESAVQPGAETTEQGAAMISKVVDKVGRDEVGHKSLERAFDAPTISNGLTILGGLIDNAIPGTGETVELKVSIKIPTAQPGLSVTIDISGLAARGTDGATTTGVTVLGNPKRVEIAAKLSIGAGAEAIGIESSASIGIFVRAGSDQGTTAALQALSYGAYRGAPVEAFANLWAPPDKATEVRKKANRKGGAEAQLPERTKRQRAEMWAAMIEEQYFQDTGTSTFADVGAAVDGGFGINFGKAQLEIGWGETIFSHYDEEVLKETLGDRFAEPVRDDAAAKGRRDAAKGDKNLALSGSFSTKVGSGKHEVELSLSISGDSRTDWGVEIVGGASTPSDASSPTDYDKIMNGWITGCAEMIKKLRDFAAKLTSDDDAGVWGGIAQLTADYTALLDVASNHGIRDAMAKATESTAASEPGASFGTPVGGTQDAVTKASALAASTMFQFVFTFGHNGGKRIARVELRSKRGIDIGGGSPVTVSASKTTRLFALGNGLDGGVEVEVLGGRKE